MPKNNEHYNLEKISFDEYEKKHNYKLKYVKINEIEKVLKENIRKYGNKRGISTEMLELFRICKDKLFCDR